MSGVFQRPGGSGSAHQTGELQCKIIGILVIIGDEVRISDHIQHQIGGEEINDIGFLALLLILPDKVLGQDTAGDILGVLTVPEQSEGMEGLDSVSAIVVFQQFMELSTEAISAYSLPSVTS